MRRRHLLATMAGAGASGFAGCGLATADCPDDPIADESIPAGRRSIRFLREETRLPGVEPDGPPSVAFDPDRTRVVVKGIFAGATPRSGYPKDMVVVDRLAYDEPSDTLRVRLRERECRSGGAAVGGETTPYELTVTFPVDLPGRICAQEGGGFLADRDSTHRTCVSR